MSEDVELVDGNETNSEDWHGGEHELVGGTHLPLLTSFVAVNALRVMTASASQPCSLHRMKGTGKSYR